MKLSQLLAATLFLASLALPALGQAPAQPVRVGEFDDRPVVDASGNKIADVYDVVVDTEEARVAYIVFSVGMKVVPVQLPSPELAFTDKRVELALTRARLEGMPALDMAALGPRYKRGRDFQGNPLKDPNGVLLGEVKDLMFDLSTGSVSALVVQFDPKVRPSPAGSPCRARASRSKAASTWPPSSSRTCGPRPRRVPSSSASTPPARQRRRWIVTSVSPT
jgi:sporulation protein YlmC with PRC-barrel domain